jgi:hypothetical protein
LVEPFELLRIIREVVRIDVTVDDEVLGFCLEPRRLGLRRRGQNHDTERSTQQLTHVEPFPASSRKLTG